MKTKILLSILITLGIMLSSCTKEDTLKDEKTLKGKWVIKTSIILGMEFSGNGDYLKFNECSDVCSGEDYESTNKTTGLFTYEMSTDEKTLIIDDIMDEGGNWDGTWNVDEFTYTSLKISKNTFLGKATFIFNKQ